MTLLIGPYASAAHTYREAWGGVLPLPPLGKTPPPAGYTGHDGPWPTDEQVAQWVNTLGEGNVALRLPDGVIGIDVDHYGDKRGADILAELEAQWGALPATWVSSSRSWPSGIRLFRVPVGVQWATVIPGGIEIIQHHHRYMVVWPSVHPEGGMYRWISPDGEMEERPPTPDELPMLPDGWQEGLSRQWATTTEKVDNGAVSEHREPQWSHRVTEVLANIDVSAVGGRHDAATAGAMALARLEQLGHHGASTALDALGERFVAAVTAAGTGQRSGAEAVKEWSGAGGILPSARERARTSPAVAETYIDPSWVQGWVAETQAAMASAKAQGELREAHALLAEPEEPYDWLVEGLIERGDRLILTGPEGGGKSTLLRQMAVQIAAGVHPFTGEPCRAALVLIIDCENSTRHIKRKLRPLAELAGPKLATDRLFIVPKPEGIDLGTIVDIAWLQAIVAEVEPELIIIGPIYKMSDGDPIEEQTAKVVIRAIDTLRARYDCAVLIEAHTPHDSKTERPYGASVWKRWPEFGLYLDRMGPIRHWRGARDERDWPPALMRGQGPTAWPWEKATDKAITFVKMMEVQRAAAKRMSTRAIADALQAQGIAKGDGTSHTAVGNAIRANQEQWNAMLDELGFDDAEHPSGTVEMPWNA
jgi:hypothetical protein